MSYFVQLVDLKTDLTTVDRWDMPWHDHSFFYFAEGNGSCDCNRGSPFGIDSECNTEANRFVIVRIVTEGGIIITDDAAELNPHNDPSEMVKLRDATPAPVVGL